MALPPLTYRSVKGSALTAAEFDGNIENLDTRVTELETNPPTPVSITGFTVSGSQFTVQFSDASTAGPYTLPAVRWRNRGEFADATVYALYDVFYESGTLYLVKVGHTSELPFDPDREISGDPAYEILLPDVGGGGGGLGGFTAYASHSSATLTIDADDANVFYFLNSSANDITVTIPDDSTAFDVPIGTTIGFLKNHDLNSVTLEQPTGFYGNADISYVMRRVGAVVYVRKIGVDSWIVYGDTDKSTNIIRNDTGTGTVNVTWSAYARRSWVVHNAGSGVTYDLRTDAQEPKFHVGSEIGFIQAGAGQMTFTCSGGTLVKKSGTTPISTAAGSWVRLIKTASNTWTIIGDYS